MSVNNVIAQATGGQKKIVDNVATVGDVKTQLGLSANYVGSVNGQPANDTDSVKSGDFVTFAEKVKGAGPKGKPQSPAPKGKGKPAPKGKCK